MSTRLSELLRFRELQPDDPFVVYALALEYRSLGDLAEAEALFEKLLLAHPDYVPQYLMYGKLLFGELGKRDRAIEVLKLGIGEAQKAGNRHAENELRAELETY